jgi:predicted transcriptional regulator
MGKKIDEAIIEQIPVLFEELKSKAEVARRLGISPASVNKYLAIYNGAPVEVVANKRVKVDEELIAQINEKYKSCKNMAQVAKELGISPTTVKNHLSEENLKLKERVNDDRDALWFYIHRLFGPDADGRPVSEWNVTQMMKFNRQGMGYKSQLLTLKWFYEVEKNPIQEKYKTIGIIPYVYDKAALYYKTQEKKRIEVEEAIEKQLEQDRIEIKYNPSDYIGAKKKKKMIDLDQIVGDTE